MFRRRRSFAGLLETGSQPTKDRGAGWLRNAMTALGLLALCAAVVSWTAQFRLVFAVKPDRLTAGASWLPRDRAARTPLLGDGGCQGWLHLALALVEFTVEHDRCVDQC
jgi:hypothetical protein